eukprot:414220-Amphidinium_carterae.1
MLADSKPTFVATLQASGVPVGQIQKFKEKGVDILNTYANLVGAKPGTKETDEMFLAKAREVLGDPLSLAETIALRKAWVESNVMWLAHLKSAESSVKQVPLPE